MQLTRNYEQLLLDAVPMLDVRAPIEFAKGAFPAAVNIPLLDDDERAAVGTAHRKHGARAAVELGHRLVSGQTKARRIAAWTDFVRRHAGGVLYCFRGGQRSAIVQQWLAEAGMEVARVEGGYKAMRSFMLSTIESLARESTVILLGGRAGVGKTDVITALDNALDLEGLARHRGSAFGRRPGGQPATVDFEHQLGIRWLQLNRRGTRSVVMEDESRCIGSCTVPTPLWEAFQRAPLVQLEAPLEQRVARVRVQYVEEMWLEFQRLGQSFNDFEDHLLNALSRISRRLGGLRYQQLAQMMRLALDRQLHFGELELHDAWIETLLVDYYDPMYDYQLQRSADRIVVRGEAPVIEDYLNNLTLIDPHERS